MNRDDIIRMVNKAGGGQLSDRQFQLHGLDTITNFANLVASAEREACAKVCDDLDQKLWEDMGEPMSGYGEAIREIT